MFSNPRIVPISTRAVLICLFVLTCCSILCVPAFPVSNETAKWTVDNIPNPWTHPAKCFRLFPAIICDVDSKPEQDAITFDQTVFKSFIDSVCLCDRCSAIKGVPIGVAIIGNPLARPSSPLPGRNYDLTIPTFQEFADGLRRKWKLGGCENDLLLLSSPHGGALSIGAIVAKLIPNDSFIHSITEKDIPTDKSKLITFAEEIRRQVEKIGRNKAYQKIALKPEFKELLSTVKVAKITVATNSVIPITNISEEAEISVTASSLSANRSLILGSSTFIAAVENDEFKLPEGRKADSSLVFIIAGSLFVLLVSLIALFLIIWYLRTKTGNIQPTALFKKPSPTEEKVKSDIKAVKYEPCQTQEPGLSV